jgi:hypothetical protein
MFSHTIIVEEMVSLSSCSPRVGREYQTFPNSLSLRKPKREIQVL